MKIVRVVEVCGWQKWLAETTLSTRHRHEKGQGKHFFLLFLMEGCVQAPRMR